MAGFAGYVGVVFRLEMVNGSLRVLRGGVKAVNGPDPVDKLFKTSRRSPTGASANDGYDFRWHGRGARLL